LSDFKTKYKWLIEYFDSALIEIGVQLIDMN